MTAIAAGADKEKGHNRLQWQMLAGFLAGLLLGLAVYSFAGGAAWVEAVVTYITNPVGQIFLRLLFMLVIPLLFSALVVGVSEMGEAAALKKIGIRTLVYTVVVSSIAVAVSLTVVNVIKPGAGVDRAAANELLQQGQEGAKGIIQKSAETPSGVDAVINIVPSNFIAAMSQNDILAVMFFALFFGIGLLLTKSENTDKLKQGIEAVFEISMKLIGLVIRLAPIAIFCFMFNLAAQFGWEIIEKLAAYVGVVLLALGLQMFGVFPLILKFLAKNLQSLFLKKRERPLLWLFRPPRPMRRCPPRCVWRRIN